MEKENCEQILEIRDKTVVTIIKEFMKDGVKTQFNSTGDTKGKYNARHTETLDLLQRIDGSSEWESRAVDVTTDGDTIMLSGKGVGRMNSFQGELSFMTMSKKLAWLNSTKAWVEGTADMSGNEATMKIYAVKQMEKASTPM